MNTPMVWVYSMPVWLVFVVVVGVLCLASGVGLTLFLKLVPQRDELTHNDFAGPIVGAVGTALAVVLSFLLIANWQGYDQAAATVEQESSSLADLYHAAESFPPPLQQRLKMQIRTYVDAVVDEEWALMRTGGRSKTARSAIVEAQRLVASYNPASNGQQSLQQAALGMAQTAQDARRARLFDNDQGIPIFMWVGNLLLATVTIVLCYFFRVRSRFVHYVMTLSLATVIAIIFVLTALVDYPFRGQTQISPALFVSLQRAIDRNEFIGSD
jgi:hypothetical protein